MYFYKSFDATGSGFKEFFFKERFDRSFMNIDSLLAFLIITVVVGTLFKKIVFDNTEEKYYLVVLMAGFMVRVGVAAIVNLTALIPEKYYMDSVTYQKLAMNLLNGDDLLTYAPAIKNYAWLLSRVYYFLGAVPLTAHVLICVIGIFVLRNIYRTTELLANRRAAIIVMVIWAFMPSYVFVTSQTFRDPVIFLVISTIIYWMTMVEKRGDRFAYLRCGGIFVMAIILCKIRPHQMDVMLLSFGLLGVGSCVFLRLNNQNSRKSIVALGLVSILVLFFNIGQCSLGHRMLLEGRFEMFSMLNDVRGLSANPKIHWAQKNLDEAVKVRNKLKNEIVLMEKITKKEKIVTKSPEAEAVKVRNKLKNEIVLMEKITKKEKIVTKSPEAEVLKEKIERAERVVQIYSVELKKMQETALGPGGVRATELGLSLRHDTSLWEFLYRTPIRILVVLFSPFPWQISSNFLKIAVLENVIFIGFFVSGMVYVLINRRETKTVSWFSLIYLVICLLVYSVTEGNVGTAYRHRMQYLWLFYAPGALYVSEMISRWRADNT